MIDIEEFLASHPEVVVGQTEAEELEDHAADRRRSRYEARSHTHTVPVESSYTSGFGVGLGREEPQAGARGQSGRAGGLDAGARARADDLDEAPLDHNSNKVAGAARFGGFGGDGSSDGGFRRGRSGARRYGKGSKGRYGRNRNGYRPYPQGGPVKRVPDDPADVEACREAALTLLDASARSSGSLVTRLVEKGYDEAVSQDVVARLVEVHLIDDEDYARGLVRSCAGRMMGERGTLMELSRKGVDAALAQSVVQQARQLGVFEDAAWELGRSVAAKTRGLDRQVRYRRLWSAGGRKGHDPSILREVAQELFSGTDDQTS